jgi:hypothetical protein
MVYGRLSSMARNLGDLELARKLREMGVDVGPITSTTRDVYKRKYHSMLALKGSPHSTPPRTRPPTTTPPPNRTTSPPSRTTPPLQKPSKPAPLPSTPAPPPAEHPAPPLTVLAAGEHDQSWLAPPYCQLIIMFNTLDTVVKGLLYSFNNWQHIANDTAFLFPNGEVIVASRAILATQCSKMIPILYNTEGTNLLGIRCSFCLNGSFFPLAIRHCITVLCSVSFKEYPVVHSTLVGT